MNISKLILSLLAIAGLTLFLAGCSGNGVSIAPPANQFAGAFRGQFSTIDRVALGTMDNIIDKDGVISGMTTNGGSNMLPGNMVVRGTVGNDGAISIWFGQHHLTGTMDRNQARGAGVKFAGGLVTDHFDNSTRLFEWWDDTIVSN